MVGASRTTKSMALAMVVAVASVTSLGCGDTLPPAADDVTRPSADDRRDGRETNPGTSPPATNGSAGVPVQGAPAQNDPAASPARVYAVFVSSEAYRADELAGVSGADRKCGELADEGAFGLRGKKWAAWLSDGATSARTRLGSARGPWMLLDGTRVAADINQLVGDAPLDNAIDMDELGIVHLGAVWTGTLATGVTDGAKTCESWTGTDGTARTGTIGKTKPEWTAATEIACAGGNGSGYGSGGLKWPDDTKPFLRIYCFEID